MKWAKFLNWYVAFDGERNDQKTAFWLDSKRPARGLTALAALANSRLISLASAALLLSLSDCAILAALSGVLFMRPYFLPICRVISFSDSESLVFRMIRPENKFERCDFC